MMQLQALPATAISHSRWSIGGETLDRDYANYDSYKAHLGPLGAKRLRLQAGWARCEQQQGRYDFAWLDHIVNDARQQGVQPWLQLSYGNPIYPNGGTAKLAGGIPTGAEATAAWQQWVKAIVVHFKDRVTEWEIWNEPDIAADMTHEAFAEFYVLTAKQVRAVQADAKLIALGLANVRLPAYVSSILSILQNEDALDLVNAVSVHGYCNRPEDNYEPIAEIADLIKSFSPNIAVWQGENGAPSGSKGSSCGALTKHGEDWSELSQAKWNTRRMAGDMLHGIAVTNIFQMSDMRYNGSDHLQGWNSKGLIETDINNDFVKVKLAWHAFHHFATIMSGDISKITADHSLPTQSLGFSCHNQHGQQAYVYWDASAQPLDQFSSHQSPAPSLLSHFSQPYLVDLLSGQASPWQQNELSISDMPQVIVEQAWLQDLGLL